MLLLNKSKFFTHRFGLVFVAIALLAASFFLLRPNKSEVPVEPRVVSNLFIYKDIINNKEPSFSLKLPDGWYRDLGVKGKERLLAFSPDKSIKGITYRAAISAGVAPTALNLTQEVERARREIGLFAVNNKFITDKQLTIKGYPAHLLEYNSVLENDSQGVKEALGENGLLLHHIDVFTVKNGYFIDISAYTYEWALKEFIDVIEKSLNTVSFNPST